MEAVERLGLWSQARYSFEHVRGQPHTQTTNVVNNAEAKIAIVFQEPQQMMTSLSRKWAAWLATGALTLCTSITANAQDAAQPPLPTVTLGASFINIKAEVASRPREHQIGLMFRTNMGNNDGMIFVFEQQSKQCFWMKNTLIPLQVAFVDDDGTIVNLDEMKPQTTEPHCSSKPVRYVLEMNTGWFTKHAIKPGMKLTGAPFGTPR
ncbi:DUF192 domain-containing protein [Aquabacterium sp.]|uniref:DUF192 domain-containing protein n=1 Tax=Aquabacterium sp. TaxID=1872578 RepID=UPI0035B4E629